MLGVLQTAVYIRRNVRWREDHVDIDASVRIAGKSILQPTRVCTVEFQERTGTLWNRTSLSNPPFSPFNVVTSNARPLKFPLSTSIHTCSNKHICITSPKPTFHPQPIYLAIAPNHLTYAVQSGVCTVHTKTHPLAKELINKMSESRRCDARPTRSEQLVPVSWVLIDLSSRGYCRTEVPTVVYLHAEDVRIDVRM